MPATGSTSASRWGHDRRVVLHPAAAGGRTPSSSALLSELRLPAAWRAPLCATLAATGPGSTLDRPAAAPVRLALPPHLVRAVPQRRLLMDLGLLPSSPESGLLIRYRIARAVTGRRRWCWAAAHPEGGSGSTRTLFAAWLACRRDGRRRDLPTIVTVTPSRAAGPGPD